ncbi:MAG: histidinol dehydrogenase [Armatimonadota bacterium]|nr:histidinol dehydrogenase [Armatimonadota bacterium]MDR7427735.1 histidinol dehydrogenase [Armatimonadota bacterium]MDR7464628.1 histidinol dehydrogenase [Armatimonadota bacterium]MDR7469646.1 histidinol dehydrogenase [Armatimonadota bacterium]MDR7474923.1 histidinol dehydrogenase [Armatimonadota bacterium]
MTLDILPLSSTAPERLQALVRRATLAVDGAALESARRTLAEVRERGDAALLEYTRRWDGVALSPELLLVSQDEVAEAQRAVGPAVREALQTMIARTLAFNERLLPHSWEASLANGVTAGVRVGPVAAAGVYVPSGKGRFPSIAVTLLAPAVVAGVPELNLLLPPQPDGSVDPAVLVVCDLLGVRRIFRCNGVAGVAALAVGTETIPPVPLIAGPGNPHIVAVQLAAQALGVRVPAILGPTEAMILADEGADPRRLALDLCCEAEHGPDSAAVLVTTSRDLAEAVVAEAEAVLQQLPEQRRKFAAAALRSHGAVVLAGSMDEAVAFVNRYAPEHLQLATRNPLGTLADIRYAGEVLLGQETPFSAATYAMGLPAALPTGGAARCAGGITVLSFLKVTSTGRLDPAALAAVLPVVETLGTYETFPAHVRAVRDRVVEER